jgi:hypothetical protein
MTVSISSAKRGFDSSFPNFELKLIPSDTLRLSKPGEE